MDLKKPFERYLTNYQNLWEKPMSTNKKKERGAGGMIWKEEESWKKELSNFCLVQCLWLIVIIFFAWLFVMPNSSWKLLSWGIQKIAVGHHGYLFLWWL